MPEHAPKQSVDDLSSATTSNLAGKMDTPTGTPTGSKYLRDDNQWWTPSAAVAWGGVTGTLSSQTDLQAALDGKSATSHAHAGVYEPANANIQSHVASAHAPSNAQKNSDITKAEIEAKLTGEISSHTHASTGAAWGGITSTLSAQTDLQAALDAKQAALVSATNIKTVNGATLLGSGDVSVSAADPLYAPGPLTVANGSGKVMVKRLVLTGSQRLTIAGTGRLRIL